MAGEHGASSGGASVVSCSTLAAVAEARPRTRDALLAVPGMGQVKADRYGQAVLDLVASTAPAASPSDAASA